MMRQMKEAVKLIDGRAETECSGNVTKERLKTIREIGVDYVSCGAFNTLSSYYGHFFEEFTSGRVKNKDIKSDVL